MPQLAWVLHEVPHDYFRFIRLISVPWASSDVGEHTFQTVLCLRVSCLSGECELGFCKKEKNLVVSKGLYLYLSVSSLSYCKDLKCSIVSHTACFLLQFCFWSQFSREKFIWTWKMLSTKSIIISHCTSSVSTLTVAIYLLSKYKGSFCLAEVAQRALAAGSCMCGRHCCW